MRAASAQSLRVVVRPGGVRGVAPAPAPLFRPLQVIMAVQKETGLTMEYTLKILDMSSWDKARALAYFRRLQSTRSLPDDALQRPRTAPAAPARSSAAPAASPALRPSQPAPRQSVRSAQSKRVVRGGRGFAKALSDATGALVVDAGADADAVTRVCRGAAVTEEYARRLLAMKHGDAAVAVEYARQLRAAGAMPEDALAGAAPCEGGSREDAVAHMAEAHGLVESYARRLLEMNKWSLEAAEAYLIRLHESGALPESALLPQC
eukprot:m51a1_g4287 hypothetical protein (264) ;mRNA; r:383195-386988